MTRPWWLRLDGAPPKHLEAIRVHRDPDLPLLPGQVRTDRIIGATAVLLLVAGIVLFALGQRGAAAGLIPGGGTTLATSLVTLWRLTPARRRQVLGRSRVSTGGGGQR